MNGFEIVKGWIFSRSNAIHNTTCTHKSHICMKGPFHRYWTFWRPVWTHGRYDDVDVKDARNLPLGKRVVICTAFRVRVTVSSQTVDCVCVRLLILNLHAMCNPFSPETSFHRLSVNSRSKIHSYLPRSLFNNNDQKSMLSYKPVVAMLDSKSTEASLGLVKSI